MSLGYFIRMRHLPSFVLGMFVWCLHSWWLMLKLIGLNRILDWDFVFKNLKKIHPLCYTNFLRLRNASVFSNKHYSHVFNFGLVDHIRACLLRDL